MKNFKKIIEYILIALIIFVPLIFFVSYHTKSKFYSEYSNMNITVGNYYERGTAGRGATVAKYIFNSNNIKYKSSTSFATFKNSNPIVGRNYIVVYNSKNPKQSTCFLNLPVHDSIRHYFKKGSITSFPIESYQRSIDSFYFSGLTTGFISFFPPYYKKEDFPELEYLWRD